MSGAVRPAKRRRAPLSVRLTDCERRSLEARAGSLPVSSYVKHVLFGEAAASKRRRVSADQQQLGRVLALLGSSGLAASLQRFAAAAESGSLPLGPETEFALRSAFADVAAMRGLLMQALGVRTDGGSAASLSETFGRQAGADAP